MCHDTNQEQVSYEENVEWEPYRPLIRRPLVVLNLSLYEKVTVKNFDLALVRAGVSGTGVKCGPVD